jgi:putative sigma-54 modulation protein
MDLQIRGHDVMVNDGLREFARQRASKLDRLIDRVVDAKLELRKRHQRSGGEVFTAQLTIQSGRRLLRAEEHDHDPSRAIDLVIDKMDRQIRRFHDKRTKRKLRGIEEPEANGDFSEDLDEAESEDERPDRIVRTKRFSLKPMDPDEAIDQMELLGHDFFLFHNAEEDHLNVVYRRRDGSYGLLAPTRS